MPNAGPQKKTQQRKKKAAKNKAVKKKAVKKRKKTAPNMQIVAHEDDVEILTAMQMGFVKALAIDPRMNITHAALTAGCTEKSASVQGNKWLNLPKVQAALEEERAFLAKKSEISRMHVINEMANLAFANMGDYVEISKDKKNLVFNFENLTREQSAAIQEVTSERVVNKNGDVTYRTKLKLVPKNPALKDLATILGYLRREDEGGGNGNTVVNNQWVIMPVQSAPREIAQGITIEGKGVDQ